MAAVSTASSAQKPLLSPVRLGNIEVKTPVLLSPMAGVTNWPFRALCEESGLEGLYVAEMITARALVARNPKAFRLCRFAPEKITYGPLAGRSVPQEKIRSLQLYGVNPLFVRQAAQILVEGGMADHIDLNFGCPVAKITRHGGGSALPWKTDLFTEVVHEVVAMCEPARIPVTAKIRVGINADHTTFLEAGHIAQEEGCAAVILHARTTAEYYGGHSNWDRIGELKSHLSIPLFGNGDIWSADDAKEMIEQTGCDGVAVGRGAQGRPWIFSDIKNMLEGRTTLEGSDERFEPNLGELKDLILKHVAYLIDFYDGDERMAVHDIRKHIGWYLKGYGVGGEVRARFMKAESLDDLHKVFDELDLSLPYPQALADKPRGRAGYAKKVHLPYGWLDSRTTDFEERKQLFGNDPMDASY